MQEMNNDQSDILDKKYCKWCDRWLFFNKFSLDRKTKDKLFHKCKECHNKYKKEKMTPEKQRKYILSKKNITLKQYNYMLAEQNGVCAICKQPETQINPKTKMIRPLSIDHNHDTGNVRSLLCSKCNVALGLMEEDPERIKSLLAYAEWCQAKESNVKIVQLPLSNNNGTNNRITLTDRWKGEEPLNDFSKPVDTYIPVKQVAKEISVNKEFILQEIRAGNLEAYMLGGGYKILRSTLNAYIEARKFQPVNSK